MEKREPTDYEQHLRSEAGQEHKARPNPFEGKKPPKRFHPQITVRRGPNQTLKRAAFHHTADGSVVPTVHGIPLKGIELAGAEPTFRYKHDKETLDQADKQRHAIQNKTRQNPHGRR